MPPECSEARRLLSVTGLWSVPFGARDEEVTAPEQDGLRVNGNLAGFIPAMIASASSGCSDREERRIR
jgi:hypothetical protein